MMMSRIIRWTTTRMMIALLVGGYMFTFVSGISVKQKHGRLSALIKENRFEEAREESAILYKYELDMGYSGFLTVDAQKDSNKENHIFFWYQPCSQCGNVSESPLLGKVFFFVFLDARTLVSESIVDSHSLTQQHSLVTRRTRRTGNIWCDD